MPTLNILLSDHEAAYVDNLISSGRYWSVEEAIEEGLRLLEQRTSRPAPNNETPAELNEKTKTSL